MAGISARCVKGGIGFAIIAWGYSYYNYPLNIILMAGGTLILLAAYFNILWFAPLFGYPLKGDDMIRKHGLRNDIPGEENTTIYPPADEHFKKQGTTTQGGSNYGQGSMHLGGNTYRQGSEKTGGSNYANEQDFKEV